jgi:uncharacterized protein YndB with AHSA1/START domain
MAGNELIMERVFDAPRDMVWRAWTEPDRMVGWFGPKTYTTPVYRIDLRVGGKYLFCMRPAEGQEVWGTGQYREIVPQERLVMTDSFADEKGNVVPATHYGMMAEYPLEMQVTVTLEDRDGKTAMTLQHSGFPTEEQIEMAKQGWSESFDKLDDLLMRRGAGTHVKQMGSRETGFMITLPNDREVIWSRVYDAPRDLVYRICTEPKFRPQWWGPRNLTTTVEKMDVRPGGEWRIVQRDPSGNTFAFHGEYLEVRPPERIVDTFEFEGMPGHILQEICTLEDLGGQTRLTNRSIFTSKAERDGMLNSGMEKGIHESSERIAELLTNLRSRRAA